MSDSEDELEIPSPPSKKKLVEESDTEESVTEDELEIPSPPKKKIEESDSEDSSSDNEEVLEKPKPKKNKLNLAKTIPSLETLKKWAMDHNVSYKGLTAQQLYSKLKILHLDNPKDKEKEKKKKTDKTLLLRDQWKEQQEKLEKKSKLSLKEENRLAFLKDIFQNIKNKEENKEKLELRKQFRNEEIKRFDFMHNLSLDFTNVDKKLEEFKDEDIGNNFDRDLFVQYLEGLNESDLKDIVKKYASYHDALSHYSMLLLLKIIGVEDDILQTEIHHFNKLEESFMTSDEKERLEELKNRTQMNTVQDVSFIEKIRYINELDKVSKKLKKALADDDDVSELKEEEQQLMNKLKEINQRIQMSKDTSTQEAIIKNTINQLKLKYSKEDQLKLDKIQKKINILFNNPFSSCILNDIAKTNLVTKVSLEVELKVLNEISDLLTQLELNANNSDEENDSLFEKIKKLKTDLPKVNKYIKEDLKQLYDTIIEKQKQVIHQSFQVYNNLYENVKMIQNDDPDNLVTRNMIRTLQRQLQQLELYKTKPQNKIKFIRTDVTDLSERIQFLKKQLDQKYCDKIESVIKELESYYKGKPYTTKQIIQNMERQLLESSYDTKNEMDKINKLITKFEIIDLELYQKYKKEFNKENDRTFNHDEYSKLLKQLDENKDDDKLRQKVLVLSDQINKEMSLHFTKLKEIENELKSHFNFERAISHLEDKNVKPVISFHLPEHNCVPEFFKKPWVHGYSGIFYVHFMGNAALKEMIDTSSKKVVNGNDFYKGTHFLDILLCSDQKRQVDDIVTIQHHGVEYTLMIYYELKTDKLILNDQRMYKKEQDWKKNKEMSMLERIHIFATRPVSEIHQDLSIVIVHKLSKFFEKENAVYLKNELLRMYENKTVEELLKRLGNLVIFLDQNYLKSMAPMFNERLKHGYISEKEILDMDITDILREVLDNVYTIPKKDLQKEIAQIETDPLFHEFTSIEPKVIEYIKTQPKKNSANKIINLFPDTYHMMVDENKMKMDAYINTILSKVEKAVDHFVNKTIYDMLITNHVLLKGTIEPFVFKNIYPSISEKDCYASSSESSEDIIYYIENGIVYCFSLVNLLNEKITVNEFTNNPFSTEFMAFLAKLRVPKIEEEKKEIVLPSLLKTLYTDLRKMEKKAIEDSDEYYEMFIEKKDSLTKALYK